MGRRARHPGPAGPLDRHRHDRRYRDDLVFYLQAHLVLVLASMAAALAVGIPAGIA
jgi:ABC-type proline/glycine betaine transport system permease subunit